MQADMSLAESIRKVKTGAELGRYSYGERGLREEISQVIGDDNGKEIAIVTRNLYGALVLNAAHVMFIDIDFPEEDAATAIGNQFRKMLGNRAASPEQIENAAVEARFRKWEEIYARAITQYTTCRRLQEFGTAMYHPDVARILQVHDAYVSDARNLRLA